LESIEYTESIKRRIHSGTNRIGRFVYRETQIAAHRRSYDRLKIRAMPETEKPPA
jgi:hypothetical protein